jgi:hypothetical protein
MHNKLSRVFLFFSLVILIFSLCAYANPRVVAHTNTIPGFACYRNLVGINNRVTQLLKQYPQSLSVSDIGDSWEKQELGEGFGHDLLALKLENQNTSGPKPSLVLISGLKANSFGPVEINLRFAEFLLANKQSRDDVRYLLEHFNIHFIFLANPDGRVKAESQADGHGNPELITWTKNTNPESCPNEKGGVSLERNFSYQWQNQPNDPCAPDFPGTQAFSEPETQAIRDYLQTLAQANPGQQLLINLESWQNFILHPYLYSKTHKVHQYEAHQTLINKLAYGQEAVPQPFNSALFEVQYGTLIDFAHAELDMTAVNYRLGSELGGGDVSLCAYFEDSLAQAALDSLFRALKALPKPLEYAAGPEIHNLKASYDIVSKKVSITGFADSLSFYRHTNRVTSIFELYYSVDVPPWHPQANLFPIENFTRDLDYPGLAEFSFDLDLTKLPAQGRMVYIQGVAEDVFRDSFDAGFVERIWIKALEPELNLFLPIVRSKP